MSLIIFFIISILCGFVVFLALIFIKQKWVKTFTYFAAFLMLPAITFIITKVISNNLALSLGMVGALSIIRFRNPVKSPLELTIYFALISIGISISVNPKLGILLTTGIVGILIFTNLFNYLIKKFTKNNLFDLSFSTSDSLSSSFFEVESSESVELLENSKDLVFFSKSNNTYIYKLFINDIKEIKKLKETIQNISSVKSIDIKY